MPADVVCPWGDWRYNPSDPPWAAYRPGNYFPLRWVGGEFRTVFAGDSIALTIPSVALAHHLVTAHPELISVQVGEFVVDGWPRSSPLP